MNKEINYKNIRLFSLSASLKIGQKIAENLNLELTPIIINRFQDQEILVRSLKTLRNREIYVIQSTAPPVNDNLMELLIAIDSFKRACAKRINVIIPYFGYSRQDRISKSREPITCKLVANLLKTAGADQVMLMDLHAPQTMGFFDIPVESLKPVDEFANWIFNFIKTIPQKEEFCFVAPDRGALVKTTELSKKFILFNSHIALIEKKRIAHNKSKINFILGDVKNKICFLIDDIIDTGGTVLNACKVLKAKGAKKIIVLATHGLFSHNSLDKFVRAKKNQIIDKIVVTDSISQKNQPSCLDIISVSSFIAEVIKKNILSKSISHLYEERKNDLNNQILKYLKTSKKNEN